jgi:hypothetical protein
MADPRERNDHADVAIARVLGAEREARASIDRARADVHRIGENARTDARDLSERTERRVRRVVDAFERALAARLAEIDAEAAKLDDAEPISADERARLQHAVAALAQRLIGARP